jgi:hypothetical protein
MSQLHYMKLRPLGPVKFWLPTNIKHDPFEIACLIRIQRFILVFAFEIKKKKCGPRMTYLRAEFGYSLNTKL